MEGAATVPPQALQGRQPTPEPTPPGLALDRGETRSLYLQTEPDAVFATVHVPASARPDATGVVLCPPFGYEELCTSRARRAWAAALADGGHPAIRIDLPGTGDSAGSARDPDRVEAWIAAMTSAAAWLRQETGCTRVAGLGIGFGGMLVWLAAARGAPIDDLVLWAVPTQGRRLIREVRGAAALGIDSGIDAAALGMSFETAATGDPDVAVVDEGGQVTTHATVKALTAIDLTALPLSDPTRRRVLLFERSGNPADARVRDHFRDLGVELTAADGDAYDALMRYVQLSEMPTAAIARSVSWLGELARSPARVHATRPASGAPVRATATLDLAGRDGVMRERPLTLRLGSETVRGVLTEPVDEPPAGVCAVFINGGSDRRIGPNRLWVDTARRWALRGVPSLRIDPVAIGESEGREDHYQELWDYYEPEHVPRTIALLDALEASGLAHRFVIVGFCSGAYRGFRVALADPRIAGVFAIGFPFFLWNWWSIRVRNWWVGDWSPRPSDTRAKAVVLSALKAWRRVLLAGRRVYFRYLHRHPDRTDLALERIRAADTELLLLFKAQSKEYDELQMEGRLEQLAAMPSVVIGRIPGNDLRFRPLPLQRYVSDALDGAMDRVLANGRP
jgi:pimeloyl-ACP methyl ester carboxylesterase